MLRQIAVMTLLFFSALTVQADLKWKLTLFARNFHKVDEGQLYRSAQLTKNELSKVISDYKIKTVINLRGENEGQSWYDNEKMVVDKYGVEIINIGMSAKSLPHRENLLKLLEAFEDAPKPILIHCKAGADRTGEAVAIYAMEHMGKSRKEASKYLSLKYRHSKRFMPAKDYFVDELYQGKKWAYEEYYPCKNNYKYYDKNNSRCTTGRFKEDEPGVDE